MSRPIHRQLDDEASSSERAETNPYESGTRRIVRESSVVQGSFAQADDPWASEAPQSLLSVASWLVHSVRSTPGARLTNELPTITIADADLTPEELAAIDAEWPTLAPPEEPVGLEVEQVELSSEEAEAIDDFDLAPLRQSFERGDHPTLLAAAESLLAARPTMSAALPYLAAAREALRRRYITELGGQREVPERVIGAVPPERLVRDEALVLDLIDGSRRSRRSSTARSSPRCARFSWWIGW